MIVLKKLKMKKKDNKEDKIQTLCPSFKAII